MFEIKKEKIQIIGNAVFVSEEITPTRYHQLWDEFKEKEKEFGAMLYSQKDLEGRYL